MVHHAGYKTLALAAMAATALMGCPREPQQPQPYPQPGYQQPGAYPQPGYPQPGAYPQPYPQPGAQPQPYPQPYPQPGAQPAPQPQPGGFPFPIPGLPQPQPAPQPGTQPAPQPAPQPSGNQAQVLPAPSGPLNAAFNVFAQQEMAGMTPITDVIAGNFQQGQVLEQTFQMQPGKCYGAVASGAGVQEMHITFVMLQPIPGVQNPVLAEDKRTGSNASIKPCYTWQIPVGANVKVIYEARSGSGLAAGRVYVR